MRTRTFVHLDEDDKIDVEITSDGSVSLNLGRLTVFFYSTDSPHSEVQEVINLLTKALESKKGEEGSI